MLLAEKGIIPPKEQHHDHELYDNHYGFTVAIYLIENNLEVPEEWRYDPKYKIE